MASMDTITPVSKTASSEASMVLTEHEAARQLKMSRRSLQRVRLNGEGPRAIKLTDRCIGYLPSDLMAWLKARAIDAA